MVDELRWLRTADLEVGVATADGPRIAVLRRPDGPNLLAELDGVTAGIEDGPATNLRGGHRIWVAPEIPERTYDTTGELTVEESGGTVTATRRGEGATVALAVSVEGSSVRVDHRLVNEGTGPVQAATWGITQFALGGAAVLPYGTRAPDPNGLQASGSLVLWPYTDLADPRLRLDGGAAVVAGAPRPEADDQRLKLGADGRRGWLAHVHGDDVVIVRHWRTAGAPHPDRDAAAQVFVEDRFVEVETLGPLVELAPGGATGHRCHLEVHRLGALARAGREGALDRVDGDAADVVGRSVTASSAEVPS